MKKYMILIVAVLALVIFASGCIYTGNPASNQSAQNSSNITVNTTSTSSPTTTSTKTQSTKVNLISAQRAIDIVQQSNPGDDSGLRFKAHLVKNNGAPYYMVDVYDDDPYSETYGQAIGGASVDARTGVILDEMG